MGFVSFLVDGKTVVMHAFLMERVAGGSFLMDAVGRCLRMEKERGREWLPYDDAISEAKHKERGKRMPEETLRLLQRAEKRRSSMKRQ
jgi:hypothetical protein